MNHEDGRIALAAIELILAYGYGKPEQHVDATLTCNFAEVPATMGEAEWLERRGQPRTPEGDKWLLENMARVEAEKRTGGLPTGSGKASKGEPPVIDLQAEEDPMLLDKDPTCPAPDPSKLN
jgi:hypothetical protein